jgi:hypothetical protein
MKKTFTIKLLISACIALVGLNAYSENGLKNVIVEKYYISNADDEAASTGVLPVGSVTYRVFLDLLPGYNFQVAYGDVAHPLFIKTTTTFFNNEDRGNIYPNFTKTQAKSNTVMLDSWLSAGAACAGYFGILKSEDDGVNTTISDDDILQNDNPLAGIPLTTQDGLIAGTPGTFGSIGVDNEILVFDATSQAGNSFTTTNGGWYCLDGAVGPSPENNKVLIAQITTDGVLTFELNVTIGTPDNDVQYYVPKNPGTSSAGTLEILNTSLMYSPTTGIQNAPKKNSSLVSVYPNPTSDKLNLKINTQATNSGDYYKIYNAIGNMIEQNSIQNSKGGINLSNVASGLYFIEVSVNGVKSTQKFIKK